MSLRRAICVGLSLLLTGPWASAQEPDDAAEPAPARLSIAPLPILYYTPETKTAIGAAVNLFRRPAGSSEDARPSTLTPIFIYTFENQIITQVSGNHYWDDEANNLRVSLSYVDFPNEFYGIGNEVPPDESEDFTTEEITAELAYLRRIRPSLRMGAQATFGHATITEREDGRRLDRGDIVGSDGGTVVGIGVLIDFDDRDHITYPTRGGWSTLTVQVYDGGLGSDFDLLRMQLESRRYLAWGEKGVLAFRGLLGHVDGDVPFQMLPSLGGDSLLRGYFGGRFRDRELVALETELRRHVWSRLGVAAFLSAGQVAHDAGDFAFDAFHVAGGVGLRVRFIEAEKLNIRVDLGWGEDDSGTYISLGEAF